jgi:hypothetical protein
MKFPNYLISSLAIVGAFSLIIMACSADNSNSTNTVNTVGKYQISPTSNASGFFVIDTETGVVKTFTKNTFNSPYVLTETTITQ